MKTTDAHTVATFFAVEEGAKSLGLVLKLVGASPQSNAVFEISNKSPNFEPQEFEDLEHAWSFIKGYTIGFEEGGKSAREM